MSRFEAEGGFGAVSFAAVAAHMLENQAVLADPMLSLSQVISTSKIPSSFAFIKAIFSCSVASPSRLSLGLIGHVAF
jgi:hypothetical protein